MTFAEEKQTIAVAMSGGVDSSVTAALLKQQGHRVIGITMRLFAPSGGVSGAVRDAATVAGHLGIPHQVIDLEPEFRDLIIGDFIDEYRCGRTPNPCVACNRYIKFGLLLDQARKLGAGQLATGHYARITSDADGIRHLRMARCLAKDQSYFLYTLTQERLQRILFPLGELESKEEVRRLAREFGLPVAEKGDSQEVCFIPDDNYTAFLELNGCHPFAGDIFHVNGNIIGRHRGAHRYTIGQRKGLGVAWSEPLYVVGINAAENKVIVGEAPHVLAEGLAARDACWAVEPREIEFAAICKIRYRHRPVACRVRLRDDNGFEVRFEQPQKAVTPGQSVVIYQGEKVLGGGRITAAQ